MTASGGTTSSMLRRSASFGLGLLAAVLPAFASTEEPVPFSKYQVILNRMPFGDTAKAAAAEAAPANPNQPPLAASLKLVALERNEDTGAIQAGIVEGKKNHYLAVGEEVDGLAVVEADFIGERVLVRKGAQEEWIKMGGGSNSGMPPAPVAGGRAASPALSVPRGPIAAAPAIAPPAAPGTPPDTLSQRVAQLRERLAEQRRQQAALNAQAEAGSADASAGTVEIGTSPGHPRKLDLGRLRANQADAP